MDGYCIRMCKPWGAVVVTIVYAPSFMWQVVNTEQWRFCFGSFRTCAVSTYRHWYKHYTLTIIAESSVQIHNENVAAQQYT